MKVSSYFIKKKNKSQNFLKEDCFVGWSETPWIIENCIITHSSSALMLFLFLVYEDDACYILLLKHRSINFIKISNFSLKNIIFRKLLNFYFRNASKCRCTAKKTRLCCKLTNGMRPSKSTPTERRPIFGWDF